MPEDDAIKCKHSSTVIVARMLRRHGSLEVFDSIYRMHCPWDGIVRRLTRVSNDVFHLRHDYQWAITTKREPGKLARYVLDGEGMLPDGWPT